MRILVSRFLVAAISFSLFTGCAGFQTPEYPPVNKSLLQQPRTSGLAAWPDLSEWEAEQAGSSDVAIIVAVEEYAFLPNVDGAVANASDWEDYFRRARGMEDVFVLTNTQASREEILRFSNQAVAEAGPDANVWFVFIGHGASMSDGSDGALIGMDAQQTITSIEARSIRRSELVRQLEAGKQANTIVVLDTCFSGRDPQGNLLAKGTQPVVPVNVTPNVGSSTVVLSAAASNEVAGQLPGAERPAFSYLLLGALRGWAAKDEPKVTTRDAIDYVKRQLRHVKGRQQTPSLDGRPDIVLASTREPDPGIQDLMKGEFAAPAAEVADWPEGTLLDSNAGLYFVRPDGWLFGPVGMGLIISMQVLKAGSTIEVYKQEMDEAMAPGWFDMGPTMDAELIREPRRVDYGPTKGFETEYHISAADYMGPAEGGSGAVVYTWEAYARGAGWRVVLTVPQKSNERSHYTVFKTFVSNLRFP